MWEPKYRLQYQKSEIYLETRSTEDDAGRRLIVEALYHPARCDLDPRVVVSNEGQTSVSRSEEGGIDDDGKSYTSEGWTGGSLGNSAAANMKRVVCDLRQNLYVLLGE